MRKLKFVSKEAIDKGWSQDKKYCAATADGTKYLLRISPEENSGNREEAFRMQQKVAALDIPMCRPVEFGKCDEGVYTVETWVNGRDAREVIPYLADSRQYDYGLKAGRILKKIHSIPAPCTQPDSESGTLRKRNTCNHPDGWLQKFNEKINRKIKGYLECPIKFDGAENMIDYIEANRHLLAGRPQTFQHGDYHIGNMMLEEGKVVIIDFDRFDYGDPWEEFNRIVWCAQVSPLFASGMVNGYFDNDVPLEFWKLLALYISSNTLSSVWWAIPFGEEEIHTMLNQAKDVLGWYDNMKNPVPTWYFKGYYLQYIDDVPYKLKSPYNFDFIKEYGKVVQVFDDQDSGNICFETQKEEQKFFVKFAGAPTEAYEGTPRDAIVRLKSTIEIYKDLRHPKLIEMVDAKDLANGFGMIFKWADGDCMGRMYPEAHCRFMNLPIQARLDVFRDILEFLAFVNSHGYVALDFYDGSILYDFEKQKTTICDIDLFRKMPCINDMGRMWGSASFMSPEEFEFGAVIDEVTNVYTAGAFAFALFGGYQRTYEAWSLDESLFHVVTKATANDRNARWQSMNQFIEEWESRMKTII